MTAVAEPGLEVGKARVRKEDARLITGRTRWTDNIVLNGMLHIAMVRSPIAHGTITEVDVTAAKEMPGVVAVYTGADFDAEQGGIPCAWPINADAEQPRHVSIAVDKVNFAGEIVAIVVARSAAEAKDAVDAVEVDIDAGLWDERAMAGVVDGPGDYPRTLALRRAVSPRRPT